MDIQKQLDKVLQLNKERHQILNKVRNTATKKIGLNLVAISDDEKKIVTEKVNWLYDAKIKSIYDCMNQQLEQKLINPFERG